MILRSLKCHDGGNAYSILSYISAATIIVNIKYVYYKHYHLFGRFTEVSVNPQIIPYKDKNIKLIAAQFCF